LNPPPPPDAGPPPPVDASPPPPVDASPPPPRDAGPCLGQDGDCSTGVCCAGLQCQPDATGTIYTCMPPIK
jgi:hypothetical protein